MGDEHAYPDPTNAHRVPVQLVASFEPVDPVGWRGMENNAKARLGRDLFLQHVAGAEQATVDSVRSWLQSLGIAVGRSQWVQLQVAPDLAPRYVNVAFGTRCIDAFIRRSNGMQGVELKVTGDDGVCGLTVAEERLIRLGHAQVYVVNPVKGRIGVVVPQALLSVPRRIDGIPVGQARVDWNEKTRS